VCSSVCIAAVCAWQHCVHGSNVCTAALCARQHGVQHCVAQCAVVQSLVDHHHTHAIHAACAQPPPCIAPQHTHHSHATCPTIKAVGHRHALVTLDMSCWSICSHALLSKQWGTAMLSVALDMSCCKVRCRVTRRRPHTMPR